MKRIAAMLVTLCILLSLMAASAEMLGDNAELGAYDRLTVASTTEMEGFFFLDRFGNNASDLDVRALLHGYNLVEWKRDMGTFDTNETVVSGIVVTENAQGDRSYTLALANDLAYSDGTPITAWDYAFSVLLNFAPEMNKLCGNVPGNAYYLGLEKYELGEADFISGVRVLGDHQLVITVKAEYLPFFYELAMLSINPYPIHVLAPGCKVADDGMGVYITNANEEDVEPLFTEELLRETVLNPETGYLAHPSVVSGPYTLASYDGAGTASFAVNPYYKGNSTGKLPRIASLTFTSTTNENAAAQLANGQIGLLNRAVKASTIDAFMQQVTAGEAAMSNYARSGYSFISFNCERDAVSDAAVRQAISMCFDKDAFITDYVGSYGMRVDGYYGIGQWVYRVVTGVLALELDEPAEDASAEDKEAYAAEQKAWEEMSMDGIPVYSMDVEKAIALLEENGFTLNLEGKAFDPEVDTVRCKQDGDKLIPLQLKLVYPEGNAAGESLEATFVAPLRAAGIELTLEAKPFVDVLDLYYRRTERDCDMLYMATNFAEVFDPAPSYNPADAETGAANNTAIADEELYQLAIALRSTEPGDLLSYCKRWIDFQTRFATVVPSIPIYSNVYFDFYTPMLRDYTAGAGTSWSEAIIGAYLSDAPDAVITPEETSDDELVFDD